jgi:hypothetical protein
MKTYKQWITIYFVERCDDKIVRLWYFLMIYLIEMNFLFVQIIFVKKRLQNNVINKAREEQAPKKHQNLPK